MRQEDIQQIRDSTERSLSKTEENHILRYELGNLADDLDDIVIRVRETLESINEPDHDSSERID